MNIQKIYPLPLSAGLYSRKNDSTIKYTSLSLQPLQADTVSFQAKGVKGASREIKAALARKEARALRDARQIAEAKKAPDKTAQTKKNLSGEERKWGVSISTAKQIREQILSPQQQVHEFMDELFGGMKATTLEPKNLILDYADRAKSIVSIMEKSATREWNSMKEVLENMTDLNGAKIVMNHKTGKKEVDFALAQLITLIRTGLVSLHEIELQRPSGIKHLGKKEQEEFDYASKIFLDKLEDAQEEVLNGFETNPDRIKLISRPLPKYTTGNYCALHLLLQLNKKGSRPFELQIMGAREAKAKNFHDKGFKYFKGKGIEPKYQKLIDLWQPLLEKENEKTREEFLRYWHDANLQVREDELHEYQTQRLLNRPTGFFRTIRNYKLTPEYDLNSQYEIMLECDTKKSSKKKSKKTESIEVIEEKVAEIKPFFSKTCFTKLLEKTGLKKQKNKKERIKN